MICCFMLLSLTTFMLTGQRTSQNIFILRTFITVFFFFIMTPTIVILKNDNMILHIKKLFVTQQYFENLKTFFEATKSKFSKFFNSKNKVEPEIIKIQPQFKEFIIVYPFFVTPLHNNYYGYRLNQAQNQVNPSIFRLGNHTSQTQSVQSPVLC